MEELCHARGVVLESLPPYSPDLNPIEEAFAEMKGWMKKHNELQAGYPDFPGFWRLRFDICSIRLEIIFVRQVS